MKALLLSAYDARSHQYWRQRLSECLPEVSWTPLSLSPRYFSWRIRGNGLWWSQHPPARACLETAVDVCIATSMVDLATLRGLVPSLCARPTMLYFHENQFAYPLSAAQPPAPQRQLEAQMVQLYSALAADHLCFNSAYNRDSFLQGLEALLAKLPDCIPSGIAQQLLQKSSVLPVPVSASQQVSSAAPAPPWSLVWNHRWEYDKGPERLLAFIDALPPEQPLTIHVVGQAFRRVPAAFATIHQLLERRGWLGAWGFIEDVAQYQHLLATSHFVLSTAEHDFQGLSILEAVAAGCVPILPDRLAYREIFAANVRYASNADFSAEAANMVQTTLALMQECPAAPDIRHYYPQALAPAYRQCLTQLIEGTACT